MAVRDRLTARATAGPHLAADFRPWRANTQCYGAVMVKEVTPRKYYSLRAVEPRSRRPLIENYVTSDEVDVRRAALERAGYTVIVTLAENVEFSGEERPAIDGKSPWGQSGGIS